jgi:rare lipoprotein A
VRLSRSLALPLCVVIAVGMTACFSAPRRNANPSATPVPPPTERPPPSNSVPDMVPRSEPRSRTGNPPFYDVMGKRYFVLSSSVGYVERGVASWYGPGFHKVRTSTGETYDMYAMTAAHKTLPLPAYVRVTNLQNGRSIVVRVNDRGPFVGNRIIDLSYTAASKLDMLRNGTAMVEVRSL